VLEAGAGAAVAGSTGEWYTRFSKVGSDGGTTGVYVGIGITAGSCRLRVECLQHLSDESQHDIAIMRRVREARSEHFTADLGLQSTILCWKLGDRD
jgi:hypothetical protein